jgi:hypothetical protein
MPRPPLLLDQYSDQNSDQSPDYLIGIGKRFARLCRIWSQPPDLVAATGWVKPTGFSETQLTGFH